MSAISTTAAKGAFGRTPAEFEQMLEAKTYAWADVRAAYDDGKRDGHETLVSIAREYRDLGDSWPKAIRSTIDLKVRIGYALHNAGYTIGHAGDRIIG